MLECSRHLVAVQGHIPDITEKKGPVELLKHSGDPAYQLLVT